MLLHPVKAFQSSTLDDRFVPAKCIDGETGGRDDGAEEVGHMCHTLHETAPWIAIDYGTTVNVQRVELFNRRYCCGDRTKDVDIRISDELPTSGSQMFSGGTLLGHFAGPGSDGQHINIEGEKQLLNTQWVLPTADNYISRPKRDVWKICHSPDERHCAQPQRGQSFWQIVTHVVV